MSPAYFTYLVRCLVFSVHILKYCLLIFLVSFTAAHSQNVLSAQENALADLKYFLTQPGDLRADFRQTVSDADGRVLQQADGIMSISRPDKFRWQVNSPFSQLIVGDGEKIWYYDHELKQVSVQPQAGVLSSTPAGLLTGGDDLEEHFLLSPIDYEHNGNKMRWVEAMPKSPDTGFERIRIGFDNGRLQQLQLEDSFGQQTIFEFSGLERRALPVGDFRFQTPDGVEILGQP